MKLICSACDHKLVFSDVSLQYKFAEKNDIQSTFRACIENSNNIFNHL